jgi:hypothetical protein
MTITIQTTQKREKFSYFLNIIKAASLMYEDGGISQLFDKLDCIDTIGILYVDGLACSCAITTKSNTMFRRYNIAAYTNPSFRHKGFSKILLKKVLSRDRTKFKNKVYRSSNYKFYSRIITKNLVF